MTGNLASEIFRRADLDRNGFISEEDFDHWSRNMRSYMILDELFSKNQTFVDDYFDILVGDK